jgi:hypothetical protein
MRCKSNIFVARRPTELLPHQAVRLRSMTVDAVQLFAAKIDEMILTESLPSWNVPLIEQFVIKHSILAI